MAVCEKMALCEYCNRRTNHIFDSLSKSCVRCGWLKPRHSSEEQRKGRYLIIGGKPSSSYTGTTTFTDLKIVGWAENMSDVKEMVKSVFDDCAGLIIVVDVQTGQRV